MIDFWRLMTRVLLNMPSQFGGKPSDVARMAFCLIEALVQNREFNYVLRSPWQRADLPAPLRAANLDGDQASADHGCRCHPADIFNADVLQADGHRSPRQYRPVRRAGRRPRTVDA